MRVTLEHYLEKGARYVIKIGANQRLLSWVLWKATIGPNLIALQNILRHCAAGSDGQATGKPLRCEERVKIKSIIILF